MAQFVINIPDNKINEIVDILTIRFGYNEDIDNPDFDDQEPTDPVENPRTIPNPESKVQFSKRMVINFIKTQYREAKINTYISTIVNDLDGIS